MFKISSLTRAGCFFICSLLVVCLGAQAQNSKPAYNARSLEMNEEGVNALRTGNYKKAEGLFSKALAIDKGNLTAAFNLASAHIALKQEKQAITLLQEYIGRAPQDAGLHAMLGDAYFAGRQIQEAEKSYRKALQLEPSYRGLHAKLGTVYSLLNRIPDAENHFLQAVEKSPQDVQLLTNLSNIYLAGGKLDQSIGAAKRALKVKASTDLYVTLGTAYELQKDFKNSLISFQRAIDLGDKRPELKQKLEEIKKQLG